MQRKFSLSKNLITLFIAVYLLRLLINQFMGLMPQDAYYYFYSEHLALSYFDHPPMVALMQRFFIVIFGKSVAIVKLTDFIVTLFTLVAFYYLAKQFLSKHKALLATLFYGSTLLITILSINTTPDVPLLLFWTISLIVLYKTIIENKWYFWLLSGIAMGLTFDSKYTAVFLPFGFFIFLVFSKKYRKHIFSVNFLLLVLFFLITISPIFIWNYQNDWMSFKFQSSDRAGSISKFQLTPKYFFGNLGTQILILLPVLFTAMITILYKIGKKYIKKRALPDDKKLFLLSFSIPIIVFFTSLSLFYWVKLNWIMPGYIAAIILVSNYLATKLLKSQLIISLVFHLLFLVQVIFYPVNLKTDDTWYGWKEVSEKVKVLKDKDCSNCFIFSKDNYKTSAILNFYLDGNIYAGNVVGENALQFSVIYKNLNNLKGQNALFLDSDKKIKTLDKSGEIPDELTSYFDKITELNPILIKNKGGKTLRKFYVYKCINYKPHQ